MKTTSTLKNSTLHRASIPARRFRRWPVLLAATLLAVAALFPSARAEQPAHNIVAAQINVVQNDTGNTTASVTVTTNYAIGDFRIRDGSNRGDFNIQIGDDPLDDTDGLLISSVAQNGRDNGESGATLGTMYAASFVQPGTSGYFIAVNCAGTNGAGSNPEVNINLAGAWFPLTNWLCGYAFPASLANGSATVTNDTLRGSPQLVYGTHYQDKASGGGANAGRSVVDLTSLGYDSRKDGVLLVNGAKNESANYALSQVNSNNGTWNLSVRDTGNTGNGEQDPVLFIFIPKTNTTVISGRFRGDASLAMFSGNAPQFTVTSNGVGRYELKIPGRSPTNGVLIISGEGGTSTTTTNFDNIVSYQVNAAGDGWEIQTRDCPAVFSGGAITPPLEASPAGEDVASFVYIPGPTPGVTVTPTSGLVTTESGGTASFNVSLDTAPIADVTIMISSSNPAEGTASTNLLILTPNDWNVPQTITITGQDDAVVDGSVAYTIVLAAAISTDPDYAGLNPADVSVVNADNEGGVTVAPTSGLVTTEAGGTATFNVHLNTQPGANVTIALSSSDTTEGTVLPASLTFDSSNWNQDQTVTVTGVDDAVADGSVAYNIITGAASSTDPGYNGLNAADVSVSNTDNDTAGLTFNLNTLNGATVVEGQATNFTIALSSQPTADVTVNFASSDTAQGGTVTPSSRTFTAGNWNVPQSAAISGANDLLLDGTAPWRITNSLSSSDPVYAALPPVTFPMVTYDNEAILTLPSGDLIYGTGQAGIGIDGRASIIDSNTPNYEMGTLTVTLTANGTADDRLEIRHTGNDPGQIGVSGSTVSYGGTPIATFAGGVGVTPLVATFIAAATPAAAQALLRNVTFSTLNTSLSQNRRSVSVALAESSGYVTTVNTGVRVGLLRAADFQEGADHGFSIYTGAADLQLQEASPSTAFPVGGAGGIFMDFPDAGVHNAFHALLRFDNLFGSGAGQIPTNAIIVAADLSVRILDSGDASPLYRMLVPFDAANDTWDSLGAGVDQDDIESRSTFDSQIGLVDGSGSTGTGTVSVSVIPDLVAWQTGATNYGWVMPGWTGNTDGTGFAPGESPDISDRPHLRVLWLPAGTPAVSFRQDVDGYTGTRDTRLRKSIPDTENSTLAGLFVDAEATAGQADPDQVLIRFDDIIGSATNQLPPGAQVHAAMLDLASVAGSAMGDGGTLHAMLVPWQDTDTWNTMINGVTANDFEAATNATITAGYASLNPNVQGGYLSFELTPDVQTWVNGTRTNYGWAVLPWPGGGDGWGFSSAEAGTERDRPRLRVYFTVPVVITITKITRGPTSATLQFTGPAGAACSVWRATAVTGPYSIIGPATLQPDGTASFTDNSPPPGAAFYRVSTP